MYKFEDKYEYGGPFVYVNPYKQKAVKHLVDNLDDEVEYVIIFGSATHITCRRDSDIDVCVVGVKTGEFNSRSLRLDGESYDFLTYPSTDALLEEAGASCQNVAKTIYEEGVVVYARESNLTG
jgi:predicted nucleotidyltransferase